MIPFPEAPRALREHGVHVPYLRLWRAAVAGDIPAVRNGSRWFLRPQDLPLIIHRMTEISRQAAEEHLAQKMAKMARDERRRAELDARASMRREAEDGRKRAEQKRILEKLEAMGKDAADESRATACRKPRAFHYDPSAAKQRKPRRAPSYEIFLTTIRQKQGLPCEEIAAALGVKKTRLWEHVAKARLQGINIETVQIGPNLYTYRVAE